MLFEWFLDMLNAKSHFKVYLYCIFAFFALKAYLNWYLGIVFFKILFLYLIKSLKVAGNLKNPPHPIE